MITLLLFLNFSYAAVCDGAHLDKACNELKSQANIEFFNLSDGTKWKNPFYVPPPVTNQTPTTTPSYGSFDPTVMNKLIDNKIDFETELLEVLNKFEKTKPLSDRFKMAFINSGVQMLYMKAGQTTMGMGMSTGFRLPLPMNDEKAEMQTISTGDFHALIKTMPMELQTRIQQASEKYLAQSATNVFSGSSRLNGNPYSQTPESSPSSLSADDKAKMESHFRFTQDQLKLHLLKGRNREQLTNAEKNIFDRIDLIRLNHGDSTDVSMSPTCANGAQNAFYYGPTHSLNICTPYYSMPTPTLVMMLAHEIGHSLSSCSTQMTVRHLDPAISSIPEIELKEYPFREAVDCLKKAGVRSLTDKDVDISVEMAMRYAELLGKSHDTSESQTRSSLRDAFKKLQDCKGNIFFATEIDEATSDLFANVVMNAYYQENPPQRIDAIADLMRGNAQVVCSRIENPWAQPHIVSEDARAPLMREHIPPRKRSAMFNLQVPQIAKAMGCEPDPKHQCAKPFYGPNASSQNATPTTSMGTR